MTGQIVGAVGPGGGRTTWGAASLGGTEGGLEGRLTGLGGGRFTGRGDVWAAGQEEGGRSTRGSAGLESCMSIGRRAGLGGGRFSGRQPV